MSVFRDRVTLITGAGSGIGRQLARLLAAEGALIAALDRNPEGLQGLQAELPGRNVATAVADVTDLDSVRQATRQLEEQLGGVDLLIASAGLGRGTPAESFDAQQINEILQVNLLGVVNSIDAVLSGMRQRRRGHLVVLSSLASYHGLPLMGAYCASKAGVNALCDALRVELRPFGIAVTTICPGWIRTPMTAPLGLPDRALLSVEQAGTTILEAIRREKAFVAFPTPLVWRVRLLRYLPRPLSDWLAKREMVRAQKMIKTT